MAVGKLTALRVQRAREPGLYGDGAGLYLQIKNDDAKSWIYRYQRNRKPRSMGLGSFGVVGLAEARSAAQRCRALLHAGIDPIDSRESAKAAAALEQAKSTTFKDAAARLIDAKRPGWKNPKHAAQWTATLDTYAYPVMGGIAVQDVTTDHVLRVLEPIWVSKAETATRVRGRIESVIDWATARGLRKGENPARWRGHLDKLLSASAKVKRVKHHAALPYADVAQFMSGLRKREGVTGRALEFTILTAARTGEVIGAKWPEFDLAAKVWTVPASRMKGGREHRVALCDRAVEIVRELEAVKVSEFVFTGQRQGRHLSNMAMLELLRGMNIDATGHGFRSTFKDWARECTNFANEVSEAALAHVVRDKTEAAYGRGDILEKRRQLMAAWERHCMTPRMAGEVVPIRAV